MKPIGEIRRNNTTTDERKAKRLRQVQRTAGMTDRDRETDPYGHGYDRGVNDAIEGGHTNPFHPHMDPQEYEGWTDGHTDVMDGAYGDLGQKSGSGTMGLDEGPWRADFDRVSKALEDGGWIRSGNDNFGDFSYIDPGAPADLVNLYQQLSQMGYANGFMASRRTAERNLVRTDEWIVSQEVPANGPVTIRVFKFESDTDPTPTYHPLSGRTFATRDEADQFLLDNGLLVPFTGSRKTADQPYELGNASEMGTDDERDVPGNGAVDPNTRTMETFGKVATDLDWVLPDDQATGSWPGAYREGLEDGMVSAQRGYPKRTSWSEDTPSAYRQGYSAGYDNPDAAEEQLAVAASKEHTIVDTLDSLRKRETEILAAMHTASLADQQALSYELDDLRAKRASLIQQERDTNFAQAVVRDRITPVATHTLHTGATDWLDKVQLDGGDIRSVANKMHAEATVWFNKLHQAVIADDGEFTEQALGMARHTASGYVDRDGAENYFLEAAANLRRQAIRHLATRKQAGGLARCLECGNEFDVSDTYKGRDEGCPACGSSNIKSIAYPGDRFASRKQAGEQYDSAAWREHVNKIQIERTRSGQPEYTDDELRDIMMGDGPWWTKSASTDENEGGNNYAACPDHEGQWYSKDTGDCSCGSRHSPLDRTSKRAAEGGNCPSCNASLRPGEFCDACYLNAKGEHAWKDKDGKTKRDAALNSNPKGDEWLFEGAQFRLASEYDGQGYYLDMDADTNDEYPTRCARCSRPVQALSGFPGNLCIDCWSQSDEGKRMPTSDELVGMWGGPVQRTAAEGDAATDGTPIADDSGQATSPLPTPEHDRTPFDTMTLPEFQVRGDGENPASAGPLNRVTSVRHQASEDLNVGTRVRISGGFEDGITGVITSIDHTGESWLGVDFDAPDGQKVVNKPRPGVARYTVRYDANGAEVGGFSAINLEKIGSRKQGTGGNGYAVGTPAWFEEEQRVVPMSEKNKLFPDGIPPVEQMTEEQKEWWYRGRQRPAESSRHMASDPIVDDSGQGVSELPATVPVEGYNGGEAAFDDASFESAGEGGDGAADVASVPTPGQSEGDYPAPTVVTPEPDTDPATLASKRAAFRQLIQTNLHQQS